MQLSMLNAMPVVSVADGTKVGAPQDVLESTEKSGEPRR
jgi:hypothetical protein